MVFVSFKCAFAELRPQPERRAAVDGLEKDLFQDLICLGHIELASCKASNRSTRKLFLEAFRGSSDTEQQHKGDAVEP